jgi:DNA modification methylase
VASARVIEGDCRKVLAMLDAGSVQTCVTSPPYFGLRDYGTATWKGGDPECDHIKTEQHREQPERPKGWDGVFRNTSQPLPVGYERICGKCGAARIDAQLGLEDTPEKYIASLVKVFREVRRVLRDDGTLWLNLGDSYCGSPQGSQGLKSGLSNPERQARLAGAVAQRRPNRRMNDWPDIKPKDLVGIPWAAAFALRADGWYLRSEIIWAKTSCMPEAVKDRPTKAHETIFLLTKQARYFYDADAIREEWADERNGASGGKPAGYDDPGTLRTDGGYTRSPQVSGRNKRTVWTVSTQPFPGAHFATFPPKLIEPCILAGSRPGDLVLDPFNGAGTTGMVALRHDRDYIGIELNPEYAQMARHRIADDAPLLNEVAA